MSIGEILKRSSSRIASGTGHGLGFAAGVFALVYVLRGCGQ